MTLKELEIGKSAVIKVVGGEGALRQHFLDMGVIPGAEDNHGSETLLAIVDAAAAERVVRLASPVIQEE